MGEYNLNSTCYSTLQPLHQIHTAFHSELNQACANGAASLISDCFIKWKSKFLLYSDYCSSLERAQVHVDDVCRRNQLVAQSIVVGTVCLSNIPFTRSFFLFVCMFMFNVPSTARSFRDGIPFIAKDEKLGKYTVPTGNRTLGRRVAVHYATAAPRKL